MAKSVEQFHALMQQVVAGSDVAAKELVRLYQPLLLKMIRRKLPNRLRSQFDSDDFAQDVWKMFFAERPANRAFNTPEALVAYLARLAGNRIIDKTRQCLKAEKSNVNREQSLDDSQRFDKSALAGPQATPSQILMTEEEWDVFLRRQPLVHQRIFVLLRQGRTSGQIAEELNINLRMVQRVMERLRPEGAA